MEKHNGEINAAELLNRAVTEPGVISKAYTAFYGYSFGNQLLAYCQCMQRGIPLGPIATFPGWKAKGRSVKKGEKAIVLCQPVTVKRTGEADASGEQQPDAVFTRFVYKPHWFVLAQTDGQDLDPVAPIPDWDKDRALATLQITEVPFDMTDGNCQGYARERSIAVSPVAELPHKTRFHELAHVVLGHTTEHTNLTDDETTPRNLREVEAESVALLCLEVLGLPGSEFSRGYIQHWNHGNDPIPERSAQRILKATDTILKSGRTSVERA